MCKYKHLRTKIETSYIVALLSGTTCPGGGGGGGGGRTLP